MTVYFRPERRRWEYDFRLNRVRHSGYANEPDGTPCASRRAAQQAEHRARERAKLAAKLPEARGYTLAQAFLDLKPRWDRQADCANKKRYIGEIIKFVGEDTSVADVDEARIAAFTSHLETTFPRVWHGGPKRDPALPENARFWKESKKRRSAKTINLYLKLVRQGLQHATTVRDTLSDEPALRRLPKVKLLKTLKRKARPVPDAILAEIAATVPQHIAEAIVLTLYFGFRRGEAFTAQAHQVDFDARGIWLSADQVKDDEDAFLPAGPEAMAFLARMIEQAKQREVKGQFLITWRRSFRDPERQARAKWEPIKSPKRAWSTAMNAIEAKHGRRYRWHDIRANFITHAALLAGPVAAQKLARHSRLDTTQAYIEVADEERRIAAERIGARPSLKVIRGEK